MALKLSKSAHDAGQSDDALLTEKQAAAILAIAPQTLQRDRWLARKEGTAPKVPFVKIMTNQIRYRRSDLLSHINAGLQG